MKKKFDTRNGTNKEERNNEMKKKKPLFIAVGYLKTRKSFGRIHFVARLHYSAHQMKESQTGNKRHTEQSREERKKKELNIFEFNEQNDECVSLALRLSQQFLEQ